MAYDDWVPITGTEADPLIGDSEVTAVDFQTDQGFVLELENGFPDGVRSSSLRFKGVFYFQLAGDGILYLDSIEVFDTVAAALDHSEVGRYLRGAYPESKVWLSIMSDRPGLKVYRLVPIAGAELFFVCREAEMRPWRPKPE